MNTVKYELQRGSDVLPLWSDWSGPSGIVVERASGLGVPAPKRHKQRVTNQHGVVDYGYYLQPRIILLRLALFGATNVQLQDAKDQFRGIVAPSTSPLQFRRYWVDGAETVTREIECHLDDDIEMGTTAQRGLLLQTVMQLYCPDPTFYDPERRFESFAVSYSSNSFLVPTSVPFTFGQSSLNQTKVIDYRGDVADHPVIEIVGPVVNPEITNQTTGEKLALTADIAAGQTWTIDTRPRSRSVLDHTGADRRALLSDDSSLSSFRLAPATETGSGNNTLVATGTGISGATAIYVRFYDRYLGA